MKRTPLKRKTPMKRGKPLKRTAIKKKPAKKKAKKITTGKAKNEHGWKACSRYIRYRDSYQGYAKCCTCPKILPITGSGCIQAGHFAPGRSNAVLYVEDNIHAQCVGCNLMRDGKAMQLDYREFMVKTYGEARVLEIEAVRYDIVPMNAQDHLDKEAYFKKKLADLCAERGEPNPWG